MRDLCPHCGYDITKDAVIEAGDIKVDPRGDVLWKGQRARLTPRQRAIVHSLVKAKGEPISRDILAERVGYEGDEPAALINVHMTLIRKAMPGAPIETVRGVGLRWAA